MTAAQIIVSVLQIIFSLAIIIIILLQSAKSEGFSGSIAGGAAMFFGKNKGRTMHAILSKYTSAVAIMFMVTSIVLFLVLK